MNLMLSFVIFNYSNKIENKGKTKILFLFLFTKNNDLNVKIQLIKILKIKIL